MAGLALGLLVLLAAQETPADAAAKAALQKLTAKMKDVRTLTADVLQSRKTELLEKPIVSSGTLAYRREPARLVFRLSAPRKAEIHLDPTSYQVYRPDEKRLERIDFEAGDVTAKILMVFEPRSDELAKAFTVKGGASRDGAIDVRLESADEAFRKRLKSIVLTIDEADGGLRRIAYRDAEGDEVDFELSKVALNPELPADAFELRTPEGTRVLRRTVARDK